MDILPSLYFRVPNMILDNIRRCKFIRLLVHIFHEVEFHIDVYIYTMEPLNVIQKLHNKLPPILCRRG